MVRLDVLLDDAGDIRLPSRLATGAALTAQRIRVLLGLHRGELLRDGQAGGDWVVWLSTKPAPLSRISAWARAGILALPGVRAATVRAHQVGDQVRLTCEVDTEEGLLDVRAVLSDPDTKNMSFAATISGSPSSGIV